MEFGLLKQCTEFLMDVLNNDKDSDGVLQTKVIELNLLAFPAVSLYIDYTDIRLCYGIRTF